MNLVESKPMLMIPEDDLGVKAIEADQTVEATIADAEDACDKRVSRFWSQY
jgi:hypothetical protein